MENGLSGKGKVLIGEAGVTRCILLWIAVWLEWRHQEGRDFLRH